MTQKSLGPAIIILRLISGNMRAPTKNMKNKQEKKGKSSTKKVKLGFKNKNK